MALERVGHIRQQPGGKYGGVVNGLGGSSGDDIVGFRDEEAAKDLAVARAKELGWSPPYRWQQEEGGTWALFAHETSLTATDDHAGEEK